ncbi:MAG: winged helix-turn-helix transcriptional regulator [Nitrososphaerota archaeon]|jgi:DNA-binding HxlR family transcriptional regulator|uniref:winged helix-turn-helix transcriptional regulator n=1 Tax=Candidatus Bathycorpusculum sp. TaxID=2994959 RepID=UPI002821A1F8|nr:winged helix-turn-helix transcriptional regulator [Candidatus Termiticorpusculum sp.]MCL2257586.1 winged helix-turn-helix transcriptional regulator [Candidatus Termiticorpusculum sp.]MCL2292274.1 winged helix-turn-helix transcriptional regulator [Candidatus Termiticorpusculum sp.]MDR0460207.1 winged helix-turn-helix transcriptional regulator [Nitrososphaerota archaeon]
MNPQVALSAEFRKLVEGQMQRTIQGIELTFFAIMEKQKITPEEVKKEIDSIQENFVVLFQKWNLEILYTLLLKKNSGFGGLKKVLGVNSRTLSDKLKLLQSHGYLERNVQTGPPLRVEYKLSFKGKNTVLLALPLLYYSTASV